jgi:hypothetical protein
VQKFKCQPSGLKVKCLLKSWKYIYKLPHIDVYTKDWKVYWQHKRNLKGQYVVATRILEFSSLLCMSIQILTAIPNIVLLDNKLWSRKFCLWTVYSLGGPSKYCNT